MILKSSKISRNKLLFNFLIIFSFIMLSFLSIALLLHSNAIFRSSDIQFHLRRIMELYDSLKYGNVFPDFSFNQFHGSAVMALYPYLNILPVAILAFFIKSKITLLYVFFMLNTLLTFIISFYSSKHYIKSYSTAYIFSLIYSLSSVFLTYSFVLTDFGIMSSFTFLPLIIFGFISLIQNKSSWLELSLGMSFLALSHILNLIIISGFLFLWLIINIKRIDKSVILNLFKAIILFLTITSIMWLPLLQYYFNNLNNIAMPFTQTLNRISFKGFLSGIYGKKNVETIGFFPPITILISIFFYKKFQYIVKQMYWLSLLVVLAVLFFPWEISSYGIFTFLQKFQFTFRFLIIPQILLSFIFALIVTRYIKNINKKFILYPFIILIAISLQLVGQYTLVKSHSGALPIDHYLKQDNKYTDLNNLPDYTINNESQFNQMLDAYSTADDDYIPKTSIPVSHYVNNYEGFYNNNNLISFNRSGYNKLNFNGNKHINKLSLPIYMYNDEKFSVYLNGKKINYFVNNKGLLSINNIKKYIKQNNKLYIKYYSNKFRIISVILSLLGVILSIIFIFIKFIRNAIIKLKGDNNL